MLQEPLEKKKKRKGLVRGTVQHPWVLCFDGASIDDATYAGCGAVLMTHARSPVEELSKFIGAHTLHTAEYVALFTGLKVASSWNVDNLHCYGASQIIHNQVRRHRME
jgi:ribonuclease HI